MSAVRRCGGFVKRYGEIVAVDGIDFDVARGECFGFLGPNGAGKTTTMKMIYGLAAIDEGELSVLGLDVRRKRREVKARIGVVPQEQNLDRELTVRENLDVQAMYHGVPGRRPHRGAARLRPASRARRRQVRPSSPAG